LVFLVVSFPLTSPIIYTRSTAPHSCYMTRPSHPPRLDYSNYTWRRVQITKLFGMQFFSILPSPHPSSVQISSSAPCSHKTTANTFFLECSKPRYELFLVLLLILLLMGNSCTSSTTLSLIRRKEQSFILHEGDSSTEFRIMGLVPQLEGPEAACAIILSMEPSDATCDGVPQWRLVFIDRANLP
jgi:hypothetical protein